MANFALLCVISLGQYHEKNINISLKTKQNSGVGN